MCSIKDYTGARGMNQDRSRQAEAHGKALYKGSVPGK